MNQSVRVRNIRGGQEKWIPGVIVDVKGPMTYLVRVPGNSRRFVHVDHLIPDESVVRQDDQFQRNKYEYAKASDVPEPISVQPRSVEPEVRDVGPSSIVSESTVSLGEGSTPTSKKVERPGAIVSESLKPSSPVVSLRRSSRVIKPPVKLSL